MVSEEEIIQLSEYSQVGDLMEDFSRNNLPDLNKYILEPLEKAAFETFKKVDPSDVNAVMQTQMMSKMIDKIRQEISSLIHRGKLAKHQILTSTQEEEDVG